MAASLVYRAFRADALPPAPSSAQRLAFSQSFPDGLLLGFPKRGHALGRDLKWTGSHRYGIVHLGGRDSGDLRERAEHASALFGWPAPYLDHASSPAATELPMPWEAPWSDALGAT